MGQQKVYIQSSGDALIVDAGGKIRVKAGATLQIDPAAVVNQSGNNVPATIGMAAAAGGTNVCEVTITVKDASGNAIASVFNFDLWLSDAATGAGLTGTTASGAVAAKTSSGTDLATLVAKKALRVQTLATGVYILSITDSAKTAFVICAQVPGTGRTVVGATLITGNFG